MEIANLGDFEYKYYMYYRPEELNFLGQHTIGLLKFNCIETGGKVSPKQLQNYEFYLAHHSELNSSLNLCLDEYRAKNNIPKDALANVSSVEFTPSESYFLIDTSWDEDEGLAALFDNSGKVTSLVPQDTIL